MSHSQITQLCVLLKKKSNPVRASWVWGHAPEHGQLTRGYTFEENGRCLSRQLSNAQSFFVGGQSLYRSSLSTLRFGWLDPAHVLCVLWQLWVYRRHCPVVPRKHCFLVVLRYLWHSFCPPSCAYPWDPAGRRVVWISYSGMSILRSLFLCTFTSCGCLCSFPSTANRFSDESWEKHWSVGIMTCLKNQYNMYI